MKAAQKLLDTWSGVGRVISPREVKEIEALPTFNPEIGLLDNVILAGWGADALAKYNQDMRPAFGAFRQWATLNLKDV